MSFVEDFLNKRDTAYQKTESGLCYVIEREGTAEAPQAKQYVKMHYTGKFMDGRKFDSSHDRNEAFIFQVGVGRVIKGWDEGVPLFKVGSKGTLYIPPQLGYGSQGAGGVIPPNASLIFDIEVLEIVEEAAYNAYIEAKRAEYEKLQQEQLQKQFEKEAVEIQQYIHQKGWPIQYTPTGLFYVIDEPGTGTKPENGQQISVHYTGKLLNDQVFDSSVQRGQPFSFKLGEGQVIRGWDEGMGLFNEGGKGKLIIPSFMGYGSQAVGPIPANSILCFEVELVKVG